jgi:hypothetical protein
VRPVFPHWLLWHRSDIIVALLSLPRKLYYGSLGFLLTAYDSTSREVEWNEPLARRYEYNRDDPRQPGVPTTRCQLQSSSQTSTQIIVLSPRRPGLRRLLTRSNFCADLHLLLLLCPSLPGCSCNVRVLSVASSLEATHIKCHKGSRGFNIFQAELPPSLSTSTPLSTSFRFRKMSSGLKRYISPLATQGPSPQKIPRPNDYTERVALAESRRRVTAPQVAPEEGDGPAFTFGDIRGTLVFSSV